MSGAAVTILYTRGQPVLHTSKNSHVLVHALAKVGQHGPPTFPVFDSLFTHLPLTVPR